MKTKNLNRLVVITAFAGIIFACNKSSVSSTPATGQSASQLQTQSDDQTRVNLETDAATNDANTAMTSQPSIIGASSSAQSSGIRTYGVQQVLGIESPTICDASIVVDTVANPRTVTITYNGTNCAGNRTRTGVIVISIPAGIHWRDTGATVSVNIKNLKITRLSDNKSITINGTHTYTNVSGGRLSDLPTRSSITHTVASDNMSITFDDGTQRVWHVARQHVYSYSNGLVLTTTGFHSAGSDKGISEWGTNRYGNDFLCLISQPLVIQQACNFRLTGGQVQLKRTDVTTTATFGLDSAGNSTTCPGAGSYYFKLVWQGTKTYTFILPY
jgi:hypothetical protein